MAFTGRALPRSRRTAIVTNSGGPAILAADALESRGLELGELEVLELLAAYGIPVAETRLAASPDEAARAAAALGFPVVLKAVSPELVHKTDVGGVRVGLTTPIDVATAAAEMANARARALPEARLRGFLVQEMITGGRETIAGMSRDPAFGPLLMFGLGGIYVEALKDVVFRVAPIQPLDAHDMVRGIRALPLLEGCAALRRWTLPPSPMCCCGFRSSPWNIPRSPSWT